MQYYLYDQDGRYVQSISGTTEEIAQQTPEGYGTTILPPPRSTDYWNGSNWVAIGAAPFYYMKFDYATKQWIDTRNLDDVKAKKWEVVKMQRNMLEFGGFVCNGKKYDSDQISQGRILAAYIFGQPVTWTTAEDEVVQLTAEDVNALGVAMAAHVQSTHERGRLAREAIFESQSPEEVDAVIF